MGCALPVIIHKGTRASVCVCIRVCVREDESADVLGTPSIYDIIDINILLYLGFW